MTGIERDSKQWIDLSDYDLETAKAMLSSKRYLYVLFCCQQSMEKRLKGMVVQTTGEFPPRTHDLLKLSVLARVSLDTATETFLRRLTNYYIGTRYPEEVSELAKQVDKTLAKEYFERTKEIIKWLGGLRK
ncbi:MAG: HEPN domain-containing protein [Pseudomonadota bacterium]